MPKDYGKAVKWFRKAARQEDAQAHLQLGVMHYTGQGAPKDFAKAGELFRKAAKLGNADAQFNLGLMYHIGQGVPKDDAKAAGWFRKTARQGFSMAQFNLGVLYEYGQGVPQDLIEAHKWYDLADVGETNMKSIRYKDKLSKKMTPTQIAEAQQLAREWLKKYRAKKK